MWIFTTQGFYSVVEHREDAGKLIVRARTREDIEALRAQLPDLEPFEDPAADYRWRAELDKGEWIAALALLASAVNYPNFKSAVASKQDSRRAALYGRVWSTLLELQTDEESNDE